MDEHEKFLPTLSGTELTGILNRLEAATSRLEDMAASTIEHPKINGVAPTPAPTGPLPAPPTASQAVAETPKLVQEPLPESIEEFDSFITGPVKRFVNLSDEMGGPIAEQVWRTGRKYTGYRLTKYRLQSCYGPL
jgi:adenylyl cyclase-associated protein